MLSSSFDSEVFTSTSGEQDKNYRCLSTKPHNFRDLELTRQMFLQKKTSDYENKIILW